MEVGDVCDGCSDDSNILIPATFSTQQQQLQDYGCTKNPTKTNNSRTTPPKIHHLSL
jgi:hypothetical protein